MNNAKIIIIIPYYGKFNSYFQFWLNSCAENMNFEWLLITDIVVDDYNIPPNVKILKISFDELKEYFQGKFGFKIKLDTPYKLCDYKQYYGFLFEDYIKGYHFWGYCDCDLIFGDIPSFLSKEYFQNFDKLLRTGHLSFVRNTKQINENFKKYDTYKISLSSPAIYGYDESVEGYHLGFAGELLDNGYRFYANDNLAADVDFRFFPFQIVSNPEKPCVFLYDYGKIYKIVRDDNKQLLKEEVMYVHLQKRKMEIKCDLNKKRYLIIPNAFIEYSEELLKSDLFWDTVTPNKEDYFNFKKEKKNALRRDLVRLLHEPNKAKSICYRFLSRRKSK